MPGLKEGSGPAWGELGMMATMGGGGLSLMGAAWAVSVAGPNVSCNVVGTDALAGLLPRLPGLVKGSVGGQEQEEAEVLVVGLLSRISSVMEGGPVREESNEEEGRE